MELNYIHGSKITEEIKKGRELHEELESEVNVPIILMPKSYADFMYKVLYTSVRALEALQKNKISREIQVYGAINGFTTVGKIDQLQIKDEELQVWEDKTRSNDNVPSEPQMLSHKVQVMLYKKMVEDLRAKIYTLEMFRKKYGITSLRITEEFARQLDALRVEKPMQTVEAVAQLYFDLFARLPRLSATLHIRYMNQFTGKEIKLYRFDYDENEMQKELDYVLKYWKGERESMPVPKGESWKCNYCAFFGKECKVWWPQKGL